MKRAHWRILGQRAKGLKLAAHPNEWRWKPKNRVAKWWKLLKFGLGPRCGNHKPWQGMDIHGKSWLHYIYRIVYNNIYIWLYIFFKAMSLSSRCASQSISFWAVPMWPVARSRNWFWSKEARSPFHRSAMLGGSTACRSPGSIAIKGHTISYNVRR